MSDSPEIRVERQAGGWIWMAVAADPNGGPSLVLHQSQEAFVSEEAALLDAAKALRKLGPLASED
ncbi:hypothetical protein [Caballeronia sp. S22]|uniref:hypothetical protein n=1 Tax=Caballeronia sp. S22 TaxID=3137182 RepID=UPI0035312C85